MYNKKTRVHCYAFTLLPALIGLVLWSTNPQTVFPLAVLFTPVLLALTLALCLYLTEKLEKDREKNKKVNSIVIWIIPVLSNITFWISYAIMVRHMDLPIMRIMACHCAAGRQKFRSREWRWSRSMSRPPALRCPEIDISRSR